MSLFNFGKKKEVAKEPACACNAPVDETKEESCHCCSGEKSGIVTKDCCQMDISTGIKNIKVLGAGCKSCHKQYEYAKEAVANLGLDVEVEYITDMEKVMAYGVMSMPAIVVNENVVSMGKVLKSTDVEKLLHKFGF